MPTDQPTLKRDPRVSPVAGDVLETPGICRTVDAVNRRGVEFRQRDFAGNHFCLVTRAAWKRWAKKAEVLKHA
jgi:hypothetical protein